MRIVASAALALCLLTAGLAEPVTAGAADHASGLVVTVDRSHAVLQLGRTLAFGSTITNRGPRPLQDPIAHLNVLSLLRGVYVDPEDWSTARTRYLGTLAPGASVRVSWRVQAVDAGRFALYVAALPRDVSGTAPTTGPAIVVAVPERQTLDAGGIAPLAIGIPAALGLATVGLRLRRRRARSPGGRGPVRS